MSRDLTTNMYDGVAEEVIAPVVMVLIELDSDTIAVHSAVGEFVWGGHTFSGVGEYGSLSEIREDGNVAPQAVTAQLSGIPQEFRAIAMGDHYNGRPAKVYKALLDDECQLVADPVLSFEGTCDHAKVAIDESITFEMVINTPWAAWSRPCGWRYTHECQQQLYPGDMGFEFIGKQVGQPIDWGK